MFTGRSLPLTLSPALPRAARIAAALLGILAAGPVAAQDPASSPAPWARMPIAPGEPVTTRPFPPKEGRDRCISVDRLAGAQLFGDRAIELTMKNGQRYRLFLDRECPALSFYQGFYYRRQKAGQLCAGRDVIGARSGGECEIAAIIAVRPIGEKPRPKKRTARQLR